MQETRGEKRVCKGGLHALVVLLLVHLVTVHRGFALDIPIIRQPLPIPPLFLSIENPKEFLDECPTNDPFISTVRADFEIRRNGVPVGGIPCTEPVSAMPLSQYTDELILLQGLRVMHYMDHGQSGHLPWTPGTLYDWMKSRIGGINISTTAPYSFCCESYGGKAFIVVKSSDDFNRDFDRRWEGITGNIALYAHEARHVDGYGHISCPGSSADDMNFDQGNLTTRGVQWWLEKLWLDGDIYAGFSCLDLAESQEIANWHRNSANSVFRDSFCSTKPPILPMPDLPGGQCAPPLPDAERSYDYSPLSAPRLSRFPSSSKPIGIGSLAEGGSTLSIRIGLGKRSDPSDVYLAIYAPAVSPEVYLVTGAGALRPSGLGLAPWKANRRERVDEKPFGDLPVALLRPGSYFLGLLVTPPGNMSRYNLWITHFAVP